MLLQPRRHVVIPLNPNINEAAQIKKDLYTTKHSICTRETLAAAHEKHAQETCTRNMHKKHAQHEKHLSPQNKYLNMNKPGDGHVGKQGQEAPCSQYQTR